MELRMNSNDNNFEFENLIGLFSQTQTAMQIQAARSVDIALVVRNWLFGWYIVEFENGGLGRAELYGKELIKRLSEKLTANLGKGFSKRSLEQYRKFYSVYKEITQALPAQSLDIVEGLGKIQQAAPAQSFELIGKNGVLIREGVSPQLKR
jgi:hypothetical protein